MCSFSYRATSPGWSSNSIVTQSNITSEVQAAGCLAYFSILFLKDDMNVRLEEVQAQGVERWGVQGEAK